MRLIFIIAGVILGYLWATSGNDVAVVGPAGERVYPGYELSNSEPIEMTGRVLSRRDYRTGREAELSPTDFALGWGPLLNREISDQLQVSQSNRWFRWQAQTLPIPKSEITCSAANVHLIPASEAVRRALESVNTGDVVALRGQLVDVTAEDGWRWRSSRSRSDTGAGSCELLLVEDVVLQEQA